MQGLHRKGPGSIVLGIALTAVLTAGLYQPLQGGEGGAPKAYVGEFKSGTVGVLDTRENKVTKHITVPKGVHGIAILPDGSRVFVSSDESSVISVIDAATDEVIGTIPTGKQPHGLAVGKGGMFVYACIFGDNQVLEIDPHSLKVVRTFDAPGPHNIAPSPDGEALFVAAQKPGETGIARISLRSGATGSFVPTKTIPRSINLSPDGSRLVSTQADLNEVQFYSTNPLKQLGAAPVGGAPHHVTYTPDGKLVLVVDQISNDLTSIDPVSMTVRRTIAVGRKPHWIAPTADSKYAYVTDEASDQISLVDLTDGDVEATVAAGEGPRKLVLQSKGAGGSAHGKRMTVNIQGPPPRFVPDTLTLEAGTTVEWVNGGHGVHTVTDNNGAWDSGSLAPGEKYSREFDVKGTFGYFCVPHHSMGMVGTIVVK